MATGDRIGKVNQWGDTSRFYQVEDRQYPSVTTILQAIGKPALIPWAAKMEREMVIQVSSELYEDAPAEPRMSKLAWITSISNRLTKEKAHQKELKKAGEIGSQAHSLIEWTLRGSLMQKVGPSPMISPKAQWAFAAWEKWKQSVHFKPLIIEQAVWSDTYGYAGTMDLLAEIDGEMVLVDWKTGKGIYKESFLQNAAYRHALREMGHADKMKGLIVRLPKVETDPDFEAKWVEEPEENLMHVFLSVFDTWKWINKTESPEVRAGENGPTETAMGAIRPSPVAL